MLIVCIYRSKGDTVCERGQYNNRSWRWDVGNGSGNKDAEGGASGFDLDSVGAWVASAALDQLEEYDHFYREERRYVAGGYG